MSAWTQTIDDLIAYLRWKQECGARTEEMSPEALKAFLADTPGHAGARRPAAPQTRTTATATPTPASRQTTTAAEPAPPPVPKLPATPEERRAALEEIARNIAACTRCSLCEKRTQTVPGQGNPCSPDIMFIGEAPGADEDIQGLAFVGAAGQLLTKMIAAMGYTRDEVFIANICKCRPPNNRPPTPEEMDACLSYLQAQIAIIRPKVIVALGGTAVQGLLRQTGISKLRGTWTTYAGIPLMPTFHPSYLLRLPPAKKLAWADLKRVLQKLGRPVPENNKDVGEKPPATTSNP
jgi:DNA polymerase